MICISIQRNWLWASVQGGNWTANQISALTVILITVWILSFQFHLRMCYSNIKVTRHLCLKNIKNLRPQDILAFNLANKPSFQNLAKSLLPEIQAWTSRSCNFLLFLKHRCLVTLISLYKKMLQFESLESIFYNHYNSNML